MKKRMHGIKQTAVIQARWDFLMVCKEETISGEYIPMAGREEIQPCLR